MGSIIKKPVVKQDENGNDLLTKKGFPIVEGMDLQFMFDMDVVKSRLPELIAPFVLSVIKRDRDIFIDAAVKIFGDCFKSHYFNPDSTRVNNVATDEYWYSDEVAKTKPDKSYGYMQGYRKDENGNVLPSYKYPTEFDMIKAQVDITSYCEKAGYDHAYYFAYALSKKKLWGAAFLTGGNRQKSLPRTAVRREGLFMFSKAGLTAAGPRSPVRPLHRMPLPEQGRG